MADQRREPETDPAGPEPIRRYSDRIAAVQNIASANTNAIMELSKRLDRHELATASRLTELRDEVGLARTEIRGLLHTMMTEIRSRAETDLSQADQLAKARLEAQRANLRPAKAGAAAGAGGAVVVELGAKLVEWLLK